ncbi:hypothetical protein A2856_02225 [Candidatus Uhrbacteria bacterium RIFCSPHIGHO2_01_FULL_63_20]|uniref:3D domain-containing protein n=1 Tax=Candidatus Uhrbacteria bacterium RIFCSPHIGHO2_01_FULL_63_20 TaxID=1802385 RepID=A0A1F7TKH3_9BACT|nr:MAG: hypothetical protein A2856_02225 [Candidatus Uhrbacteria bacterium RIFCSPHIGHO2_01_FULL_63_20]
MNIFNAIVASLVLMAGVNAVPTDQKAAVPVTPVAVAETAKTPAMVETEQVQTPAKPRVIGRIVTVTAYTSEVGQTDSTPCISADGSDICVKYAAGEKICATNDHPMHAKLHIEGYGECTVRDRMNKRYTGTGRVDIYLGRDTPAAFQWGARHVAVSRL